MSGKSEGMANKLLPGKNTFKKYLIFQFGFDGNMGLATPLNLAN
jgi:hypothetical protein